ncbi:hypothetical protein HYV44_02250 [Candidatus Microgenomates bacterium]|nr:hypothetical protein [Candidatus Microgenomates bacterium]
MKTIFQKTFLLLLVVSLLSPNIATAETELEWPQVSMGEVKYNYTGPRKFSDLERENIIDIYKNDMETNLINSGVAVGESGDDLIDLESQRQSDSQLNQGRGGWFPETDAKGNFFGGEYVKYDNNLPQVPYKINATINIWKLPEGDKYDINFHATIIDTQTGKEVGFTSVWKKNTEWWANEQYIGGDPTWVEKYITGFVRETTHDDMVEAAVSDASKVVTEKLNTLSEKKAISDAERFLDERKQHAEQIKEQQIAEDSDSNEGGKTAWGDATAQETAYETFFWIYVQGHDLSMTFWQMYSEDSGLAEFLRTLPVGEPVNLKEYFKSKSARIHYNNLREAQIDSPWGDGAKVLMPPLDTFLANIDQYQATIDTAKPAEDDGKDTSDIDTSDTPVSDDNATSDSSSQYDNNSSSPPQSAPPSYPSSGGGWVESR